MAEPTASKRTSYCHLCGGPNGNCGPRAICRACIEARTTANLGPRMRVVARAGEYPLPTPKPPTEYLAPTPCQRP